MGYEKLTTSAGHAVGMSVGSSLTGNPTHDAYIARIKKAADELGDSKCTHSRIAKQTGIHVDTVKSMFVKYPMPFRNIKIKTIHNAR